MHLKKKQRTPVHIFIEEAQLIIPQRVGPEEARMVGAFEQIVRLGRNYGVGSTEVGQAMKAARLSSVDVEKLKTDMADIGSQAEKDDPVALRRKIVGLERELSQVKKEDSIERIEVLQWLGSKRSRGLPNILS